MKIKAQNLKAGNVFKYEDGISGGRWVEADGGKRVVEMDNGRTLVVVPTMDEYNVEFALDQMVEVE